MKYYTLLLLILGSFIVNAQSWTTLPLNGGFFKDFAFHPTNNQIVYAGSDDGGGVWKSIDGGQNWDIVTADFPNATGWHVEVDKTSPDTLYICELYGRYSVLKSIDGGNSFQVKSNGLTSIASKQTSKLAISPSNSNNLMLSTGEGDDGHARHGDGIFSSTDGGENWSPAGFQGIPCPSVEITNNETVLAGTYKQGLHFSTDFGASWTIHPDLPDTAHIIQIELKENHVIVSAAELGVFHSSDNGVTFTNIGLAGDWNFDISIAEVNPALVVYSSSFFGINKYNGSSWTLLTDASFNNQLAIGLGANGSQLLTGIFSSTNILNSDDYGASWTEISNSPYCTEVPGVVYSSGSQNRIIATLQNSYNISGTSYNKESIAYSSDEGLTWTKTGPIAHGLDIEVDPNDGNIVYQATFAQGLFKSIDQFDTWQNVKPGNLLIGDIEVNPANSNELILCEVELGSNTPGIFKSIDQGTTWQQKSSLFVNRVCYMENSSNVFAGTPVGVFQSSDNGETWGVTEDFLSGKNILSMFGYDNLIFVGTENGELHTIDNVGSITEITGPWNFGLQKEVKNIFYDGDKLIVGLNGAEQDTLQSLTGGVWLSEDLGTTWSEISNDIINTNVFGPKGFAVKPNGDLLAATYGSGIVEFPLSQLALEQNIEFNHSFSISPNPTTNNFQIKTDLPIENIQIFTTTGELILETPNKEINLANNLKGIYIIKVLSEGNVYTQRIVKN